MVKMEFGDKTLLNGDPPKVDCSPDSPAEINYTKAKKQVVSRKHNIFCMK
jgi:hypothetical protein